MKAKVAINGYGTIGKRVADAVAAQDDLEIAGVVKTRPSFDAHNAKEKGFDLYESNLDDVQDKNNWAVDCIKREISATPERVGASYKKLCNSVFEVLGFLQDINKWVVDCINCGIGATPERVGAGYKKLCKSVFEVLDFLQDINKWMVDCINCGIGATPERVGAGYKKLCKVFELLDFLQDKNNWVVDFPRGRLMQHPKWTIIRVWG